MTEPRKSYLVRLMRKAQLTVSWTLQSRGEQQTIVGGLVEESPDISALSSRLMTDPPAALAALTRRVRA